MLLGGVQQDVDAGQVGGGERSHGVAEAQLAGDVDVLGGGDARLVQLGGLDDERAR